MLFSTREEHESADRKIGIGADSYREVLRNKKILDGAKAVQHIVLSVDLRGCIDLPTAITKSRELVEGVITAEICVVERLIDQTRARIWRDIRHSVATVVVAYVTNVIVGRQKVTQGALSETDTDAQIRVNIGTFSCLQPKSWISIGSGSI